MRFVLALMAAAAAARIQSFLQVKEDPTPPTTDKIEEALGKVEEQRQKTDAQSQQVFQKANELKTKNEETKKAVKELKDSAGKVEEAVHQDNQAVVDKVTQELGGAHSDASTDDGEGTATDGTAGAETTASEEP